MNAAIATRFDCDHCADMRVVNHPTLGVIRCTKCTVRAKPRDPKAMARDWREFSEREHKQLTAGEARRVIHAIDQILARAAADPAHLPKIPHHLIVTDGILQRWAASPTGSPSQNPDLYREARLPQLDDGTQEAVTDELKRSPRGTWRFVVDWYCRHSMSVAQMAAVRCMTRRQLGREREDVLVYLRGRFIHSPHTDLVRLARMTP